MGSFIFSISSSLFSFLFMSKTNILENEMRTLALNQIIEQFRINKSLNDVKIIEEKIQEGTSKLGYLKTITSNFKPSKGRSTFVIRNGKVVEGNAELPGFSQKDHSQIDPEHYQRHMKLL